MIFQEVGKGSDQAQVMGIKHLMDRGLWKAHWQIERVEFRKENLEEAEAFAKDGHTFEEALAKYGGERLETSEIEQNLLVNAGINLMEDLLIGAGGTVFSNANAYLAVGTNATAAAATDTTLGTETLRVAMNSTFPTRASQVLTFQSDFTSAQANVHWQEMGVLNAASTGTLLNHKISDQGTKTSGQTWRLTLTITIS